MEFNFAFTESIPNYDLKMFADAKIYRWDSGVTNGSDWSEKEWYEGILVIHHKLTHKKRFFFFKTYEVRDKRLFPFTIGHILNVPTNYLSGGSILEKTINNFCEKVIESGVQNENSPFPSIDIHRDFVQLVSDSGYDAQINAIANYGEERN